LNYFIQFKNLDPLGIGDAVTTALDTVNSRLKAEPVIRKAQCVMKIAADAVELNDLASQTALKFI